MDAAQLRQMMASRGEGNPQFMPNVNAGGGYGGGGQPPGTGPEAEATFQKALQAGDPKAIAAMQQGQSEHAINQGGGPPPGQQALPGSQMQPMGGMPEGMMPPGPPVGGPPGGGGGMPTGDMTEREGKLVQLIMKMMERAKQMAGGGGQPGPSPHTGMGGGMPPAPQPDPTSQAMEEYMARSMQEAQAPAQPPQPQGGSATQMPSGGGQSTMDTMRGNTRAADIERQMNGG